MSEEIKVGDKVSIDCDVFDAESGEHLADENDVFIVDNDGVN